jgi:hypothetical protein
LLAPDGAQCLPEPVAPPACARVLARAAACGITPPDTCGIDSDLEPAAATCVADCADSTPCDVLLEASKGASGGNAYNLCATSCQ